MEIILFEYCIDYVLRNKKRCQRKLIMEKALELTAKTKKFKGSKGWLDKYSNRTHLPKLMYIFK
jgi:hypothetical protein